MMANVVFIGLVALLAVAYHAAGLLSRRAARQRDARALRAHLLEEIDAGHHSREDEVVTVVLNWCDEVAESGQDLPLTGRDLPPMTQDLSAMSHLSSMSR
jgi:hypothetical protein